jgi:hypothetical protein
VDNPRQRSAAETERMMKLQDVLLEGDGEKISWWEAAETVGVTHRMTEARRCAASGI